MAGEETVKVQSVRLCALPVMVLAITGFFFSLAKVSAASDKPQTAQKQSTVDYQAEGERLFTAHCSRCHMAPTTISPRITGTVLNHMRVRAKLSSRDEQILLKYMAP